MPANEGALRRFYLLCYMTHNN